MSKNTFGKRGAVAQPSPVREPSNRSSSGDKKFLFKFAVTLVAIAGFVCALPLIGWHAKPPTADEIADQKPAPAPVALQHFTPKPDPDAEAAEYRRQADEARRAYLDAQKRKADDDLSHAYGDYFASEEQELSQKRQQLYRDSGGRYGAPE